MRYLDQRPGVEDTRDVLRDVDSQKLLSTSILLIQISLCVLPLVFLEIHNELLGLPGVEEQDVVSTPGIGPFNLQMIMVLKPYAGMQ